MLPSPSAELGASVDGALAFIPFPRIYTDSNVSTARKNTVRHSMKHGRTSGYAPALFRIRARRCVGATAFHVPLRNRCFGLKLANLVLEPSPTAGAGSVHYVSTQFSGKIKASGDELILNSQSQRRQLSTLRAVRSYPHNGKPASIDAADR
jgi:hypothetical protein